MIKVDREEKKRTKRTNDKKNDKRKTWLTK